MSTFRPTAISTTTNLAITDVHLSARISLRLLVRFAFYSRGGLKSLFRNRVFFFPDMGIISAAPERELKVSANARLVSSSREKQEPPPPSIHIECVLCAYRVHKYQEFFMLLCEAA